MISTETFHVRLGKRRTTVSLDKALSAVIALHLGETPETKRAHAVVRRHLQAKLDEWRDEGRINVSQWLGRECLLELVDKGLSKKYWDWKLGVG